MIDPQNNPFQIPVPSFPKATFQPVQFQIAPMNKVQLPPPMPAPMVQQQPEMKPVQAQESFNFKDFFNPLPKPAMAQEVAPKQEEPGMFTKFFNKIFGGNEINVKSDKSAIPSPTPVRETNTPNYKKEVFNIAPRQEAKLISTLVSEAGAEGMDGMQAVLNSIINRTVVNPNYYGANIFDVISKPQQYTGFSVLNSNYKQVLDYLDGKRVKLNPGRDEQIRQARELIELAKNGRLNDITNGATHYYNPQTAAHYPWMDTAEERANIGGHKFVYLYK